MRLWAVLIWDLLEDKSEPPTWMNTQADHTQFSHSTLVRLDIVFPCADCHSFHMQLLTVLCSIVTLFTSFFSMWVTITLEQEINNLIHVCIICIQLCINRPLLNYQNLSIPLRLRGVPYNNNNNNNNTVFQF